MAPACRGSQASTWEAFCLLLPSLPSNACIIVCVRDLVLFLCHFSKEKHAELSFMSLFTFNGVIEIQGFSGCASAPIAGEEQNRICQCALCGHAWQHWPQTGWQDHLHFLTGFPLSSQAWADAFRSSPDLTGVVHIYEELKRKGVEFPMADLDALSPIHTPQRVSFQPVFSRKTACRTAERACTSLLLMPLHYSACHVFLKLQGISFLITRGMQRETAG